MGYIIQKAKNTFLNGKHSFVLVVGLIVSFWYPALFESKTIIHGDSIHHGLPLLYTHIKSIFGNECILWSNKIYGGHPLFAEGQGAFANPLNIFVALLFNPNFGHQLVHILAMAIAAIGVFFLARRLNISYWGSTFAALAAAFSTAWIAALHNYTISSTLAWTPWMMLACEYWIAHPSKKSALLLALPTSLSILAGYPQLPHGTVIYMFASMIPLLFSQEKRTEIFTNWKQYLYSGCLAILLFIGLTAVQIFPLTELIGQSHRNKGIGLLFPGVDAIFWAKGLLFTYISHGSDQISQLQRLNVPSLGSLMVFGISLASLFFKMPNRILGHLIATLLLFNIGMQDASPIFNFLYKYNIVPGLHYHRAMHTFLCTAVIGISILAAFAIDAVSKKEMLLWTKEKLKKEIIIFLSTALGTLVLWMSIKCFNHGVSIIQIVVSGLAIAFIFLFRKCKALHFIPMALTLLLFSESLLLRTDLFTFTQQSIMDPPQYVIDKIDKNPDLYEYKTHAGSDASGMVMVDSKDPKLIWYVKRVMQALPPFLGLLWDLPSIDGALALKMGRRTILDPVFEQEIFNPQISKYKLIDILGLKYIATSRPANNPALEILYHSKEFGIWVYENKGALPRFQIYHHSEFVDSYEDALKKTQSAEKETLFLEQVRDMKDPAEIDSKINDVKDFDEKKIVNKIRYIEKSSQRYELEVDTPQSVWLFLADANYPGWTAQINDAPTTVYSAQVLGKAIKIPAGKNHITIKYIPTMFYIGLSITIFTILLTLSLIILNKKNAFSLAFRSLKNGIFVFFSLMVLLMVVL